MQVPCAFRFMHKHALANTCYVARGMGLLFGCLPIINVDITDLSCRFLLFLFIVEVSSQAKPNLVIKQIRGRCIAKDENVVWCVAEHKLYSTTSSKGCNAIYIMKFIRAYPCYWQRVRRHLNYSGAIRRFLVTQRRHTAPMGWNLAWRSRSKVDSLRLTPPRQMSPCRRRSGEWDPKKMAWTSMSQNFVILMYVDDVSTLSSSLS